MITEAQAQAVLVTWLISGKTPPGGSFGYDLYLRTMLPSDYGGPAAIGAMPEFTLENTPIFAAVAWNLCRRGILRPGVRNAGEQGSNDGLGYSVTPLGRTWLAEVNRDRFLATEPTEVARMLSEFRPRFGDGFHERVQEAIKCYQGNAHLACCVMCGAAAESILLAAACKRIEPAHAYATYRTSQGRRRIEKLVFESSSETLRKQAKSGLDLLTYWRDDASHGIPSGISHDEAMTSIFLLHRFAVLVRDHWDELTIKAAPKEAS